MALSYSTTNINIKHAGGYRFRFVNITLDAAYVKTTGWSIAPADVGLTAIVAVLPSSVIGYDFAGSASGGTGNLKAQRTGAVVSTALEEAADNEAGLNGLVVPCLIVGY